MLVRVPNAVKGSPVPRVPRTPRRTGHRPVGSRVHLSRNEALGAHGKNERNEVGDTLALPSWNFLSHSGKRKEHFRQLGIHQG